MLKSATALLCVVALAVRDSHPMNMRQGLGLGSFPGFVIGLLRRHQV